MSGGKGIIRLSLLSGFLFGFTVVSGFILASSSVSADDAVVDNVSITVQISCSMRGSGMGSHNATVNPGTYETDIGLTTMNVFCNDNEGFAVYAIGYTDDIDGKNVLTSVSLGSSFDIVTGTGTSGTSQWAMKLATDSNAIYAVDLQNGFNNWHTVPDEYTLVAKRLSNTDLGSGATGASITSAYQVFIASDQIAGSYNGQVKYVLVHPHNASAPTACNPSATTIAEVVCMQDFANVSSANRTAIINSMTLEQQYTLKDIRDDKMYTVAKLADGNVWMTKNLDLDIDSGTTYTNEDTDLGYNTTTGEYGTASWTPMRSTYTTTSNHNQTWFSGGSYAQSMNDTPESYDPGELYWNGTPSSYSEYYDYSSSCDYTTAVPVCDESLNVTEDYVSSTSLTPQYHLGNFYNWAAALATNDSSVYVDGGIVEQSICPAGWTLPRTGTGDDSFYNLWNQYGLAQISVNGNVTLWGAPIYLTPAGSFVGALAGVGFSGGYSTGVSYDTSHPWYDHFAWAAGYMINSSSWPADDSYRYNGASIRCIARPVSTTITGV